MFSNFFKKAPAPKSPAKAPEAGPSGESCRPPKLTGLGVAATKVSDFQRAFPPVAQRANVDWAPINRFTSKSSFPASQTEVASWTNNGESHRDNH